MRRSDRNHQYNKGCNCDVYNFYKLLAAAYLYLSHLIVLHIPRNKLNLAYTSILNWIILMLIAFYKNERDGMNELSANELKTLAYKKVKDMIISNALKPGEKIVQDKLAAELGISRTPLRGALQMLEAEHLIESIPRRGVIVRKFSDEEIVDIYDCRIALEIMAAKSFIEAASQAKFNKLQKFFIGYSKSDENINVETYRAEDSKFHEYIIENCGNEFLKRLFHQGNLLVCISQIGLIRPPEETLDEHHQIIEAMVNKDIAATSEYLKQHLTKSRELVVVKIESQEG